MLFLSSQCVVLLQSRGQMMDRAERCVAFTCVFACLHLHVKTAATSVTALPVLLNREIILITTRMCRYRTSSHSQDTHCSQFMTLWTLLPVNFNTPASLFRGTLPLSWQMETYFLTQMKMALRSVTTLMSRGLRAPPILRQQKSVPALQSHSPVSHERDSLSSENINLAVWGEHAVGDFHLQ